MGNFTKIMASRSESHALAHNTEVPSKEGCCLLMDHRPASFVVSHVGKRLETDLWNESLEFMRAYTDVPHWANKV